MSRLPPGTFTQDGPDIVRPGVVRPPLFRVQGLPQGSEAAEAVVQAHRGRIGAFVGQSRRGADISGLQQVRRVQDIGSGMLLAYQRMRGSEFVTLDTRGIPVVRAPAPSDGKNIVINVETEETETVVGGEAYAIYGYTTASIIIGGARTEFNFGVKDGVTSTLNGTTIYDHDFAQTEPLDERRYTTYAAGLSVGDLPEPWKTTYTSAGIEASMSGSNLITLPPDDTTIFCTWAWEFHDNEGTGVVETIPYIDIWCRVEFTDWPAGTYLAQYGSYEGGSSPDLLPITPATLGFTKDKTTTFTTTTTTTTLHISASGQTRIFVDTQVATSEVFTPGTGPHP